TWGARAKARAPAPLPESSARSSPLGATKRTTFSSSSGARSSCSAAIRSAVFANRSRVASCIGQRFLLRGDRTRGPLLLDLREQAADLGPRRAAELAAAEQGLGRLLAPRGVDRRQQLRRPQIGQRLRCPGLGRAAKTMDRARVVLGPLGPHERL